MKASLMYKYRQGEKFHDTLAESRSILACNLENIKKL